MTKTKLPITSAERNSGKIDTPLTNQPTSLVDAQPKSQIDHQTPPKNIIKKALTRVDHNLWIESDGELPAEVGDFYRVEGATLPTEGLIYALEEGHTLSSNDLVAAPEGLAVEGTIESASMAVVAPPMSILAAAGVGVLALTSSGNAGGSAPSSNLNRAPTAIVLQNVIGTLAENSNTASPLKVADIAISDDAMGTNTITLTGADAANFEVITVNGASALYLKANTPLDYETKTGYDITVNVIDSTLVSSTPATTAFHLSVGNADETTPSAVTQIHITQASGIQGGVLDAGDAVTIEVQMSQAVAIAGAGPTLAMNIGGQVAQATYSGISQDGKTLSFTYNVPEGVVDANGIGFDANSLGLATGATMTTVWNALSADLSNVAIADNASYKVGPSFKGVYNWLDFTYSDTVGAGLLYEDPSDPTFSTMPSIDGMAGSNQTIQISWGLNNTRAVTADSDGLWEYYLTQADLTTMGIGTEVISANFTQGGDTVSNTYTININAQAQVTLRAAEGGYGSDYVDALVTENAGWQYPTITYSFASMANGSISEWTPEEMQSFRMPLSCTPTSRTCALWRAFLTVTRPTAPI